jgi:hypothetical protein
VNYTLSLVLEGNTGLTQRLQHNADGTFQTRSDQAEYEELMKQLNIQRHVLRANMVWDMPDLVSDSGAMLVLGYMGNDWQL